MNGEAAFILRHFAEFDGFGGRNDYVTAVEDNV